MKKIINTIVILSTLFLIVRCDDILEEDISNDIVTTVSPENDSTINGNSVQFRWTGLKGASDYRIQVIEESTQKNVLDSLVKGDNFLINLNPGQYNWRIRAENFAYQTAYTFPSSFLLASSTDLSIQTLFLNSPTQDFYTNKSTIIVTWDKIQTATSYTLEIDKTINGTTSTETQIENLTTNSYTIDAAILKDDAIYEWKVKAVNESSETAFSSRKILLDTQSPNQPSLSTPAENAVTKEAVDFVWVLGTDSGEVKSPVTSVIEIATDINFTDIIQTESVDKPSIQINFSTKGIYYWRVKLLDKAGNESNFSKERKFTVE